MKLRTLIAATMSLALGGFAHASSAPLPDAGVPTAVESPISGRGWKASEADNICGIHKLKRVTRPGVVDYQELLDATPQMKKIERDGIDPESPEGKALRSGARSLITKTCEIVREDEGLCSIWKEISHKDGRDVPNVTSTVLERL